MAEPGTPFRLASNLLRNPQLFDGLGREDAGARAWTGGICRDLVLYAALRNERKIELRLSDFCRVMGYDRANLLRACTPDQVREIRLSGWPKQRIKQFSNMLGLALVRMVTHNFIFPERGEGSTHERIEGSKIIEFVDVYDVSKQGTRIEFTLSQEILEQNRKIYQTPSLDEYLSLRTKGGTKRGGHPDDAARRLFLYLTWKRQYWDYREAAGTLRKDVDPALDDYRDLLAIAGLEHLEGYAASRKVAGELHKLLKRVGELRSIRMKPNLSLDRRKGGYLVRWTRQRIVGADEPLPTKYPCTPAPATWGQAPPPGASKPTRAAKAKPAKKVQPAVAGPRPAAPTPPRPQLTMSREKLKSELEDATTSLRWLESADGQEFYHKKHSDDPDLRTQHLHDARERLLGIQKQLREAVGIPA